MDIKGKGSIDLILGPVYAGKTSELLRRIRRFQFSKVKCLVVRHHSSNADRQDIEKAFQRQMTLQVRLQPLSKIMTCRSLSQLNTVWDKYDVIAIDDGHRFPDLDYCELLAHNNRKVIVSSLDVLSKLVAQCDALDKLSAICLSCGNQAAFTKLRPGSTTYEPTCRNCLRL